ncbi:rhomboid family intramembrane serine protease [Leptolyngbya sp. PCC 6406]|uniref:rhomboid family intramembrane serine protease n=1 Tax=Leptolyngbya sp. PCC 6406 TaxID=1173264 RepID=UPI0002AD1371|nr:rhomboid family intramembrane serine protease [Leptolyngbya sp. PCC 6406]
MSSPKSSWQQELKSHAWILGTLVALLWGIQIVNDLIFNGGLARYGIMPRAGIGLRGIVFAPFLHGNFGHLMANTIPLVTLGWLILLQEVGDFLIVSLVAMGVSGLGTWLIGAPGSVHVGASGVIFGYLGFLLMRGWFERSISAIALSLVVLMFYGSLVWGIFPNQPGVSWEGHLFGFVGGVLAARLIAKRSITP